MHPILTQALVAERAREWEDRAARYRLVKEWRRARREAAQVAAGSRGGFRQRAPRPAAEVPLARASREPAAVASGQPTAAEDRQPVGGRAA